MTKMIKATYGCHSVINVNATEILRKQKSNCYNLLEVNLLQQSYSNTEIKYTGQGPQQCKILLGSHRPNDHQGEKPSEGTP